MISSQPRLLQTYLMDGTLEGIRIIDCESSIEAYVIPRLKLSEAKNIPELEQPALYILLNAEDNKVYIGESENFYTRAGQHLKSKDWWILVVAIVSKTNDLEKGDVKYLESLTVERARGGSVTVENNTIPPRNNIHRFKLHKLQNIIDDTQLILTSLGYDVLSVPEQKNEQVWLCKSKKSHLKAVFKGDKFVILSGSIMDREPGKGWYRYPEQEQSERLSLVKMYGLDSADTITFTDNISFKSPNHAGRILLGRSINAWVTWKNESGQTMDEVMRRDE